MTIRPSPPRLARDKILELMSDGCYHSAHEISKLPGLEPGDWWKGLQELITDYGCTFVRRGNSIFLESKRPGKSSGQDLAALLAGIDATAPDFNDGRPPARNVDESREARPSIRVYERDVGSDDDVAPLQSGPADSMRIGDVDVLLSAKEYITSTRAILAKKWSGKTYLAMVIAEEILRIEAQMSTPMPFVVVDPTGVWYGLCATEEGEPSPHRILRLGGRNCDFRLEPDEGALAADVVVKLWPLSVILDISDMLPEDQHLFFAGFGDRLYTTNERPVHVFVDEADEFMPQSIESGNKVQRRALGVGDRLVRRARVKGVGTTLITQRPAVVNKNVLSQVDGVFFLCVAAPHDLDAVDTWMRPVVSQSDRSLALSALPTLERGEAFFVQGNKKVGTLMKFATRRKRTFDSSKTPTVDDPEPPTPYLSKVDQETWQRAGKILGRISDEASGESAPADKGTADAD